MTPSTLTLVLLCALAAPGDPNRGPETLRRLRSPDAARRAEAVRALVADRTLGAGADPRGLRHRLRRMMEGERDPRVRGLAARALRAAGDREDWLSIVDRLTRETDDRAHPGLLAALEGLADEEVVATVCQAASSGHDPRARGAMALALGGLPGELPLRTLLRLASRDRPWPVATSALIALGRKRDASVLPRLVARLRAHDPGLRAMALDSLRRLTGLAHGPEPEAWERWWEEVGEGYRFPDPDRERLAPGGRPYGAAAPALARYYGIPIRGRRIVFCFDVSASMWGPPIEAAIAELTRAVKSIPPRSEFTVVFFNEKVWKWRDEPAPGLPWAKEELFAHLPTLTTKSYTNIHDALEVALGLAGRGRYAADPAPGADDVFLVTDGEPNRGRFRDPKAIARSILRLNTPRAARIHCIALGEKPRALLERIARENGGGFVDPAVAKAAK